SPFGAPEPRHAQQAAPHSTHLIGIPRRSRRTLLRDRLSGSSLSAVPLSARGVHLSGAPGRGTRKVRSGEQEPGESLCVEPAKGQQRLVYVLWDGACPALNSPMFVNDSSGRRSDDSKARTCVCYAHTISQFDELDWAMCPRSQ